MQDAIQKMRAHDGMSREDATRAAITYGVDVAADALHAAIMNYANARNVSALAYGYDVPTARQMAVDDLQRMMAAATDDVRAKLRGV